MRRRVVITGLGCISPLGQSAAESWEGVLQGRSGAGPITHFDASTHKTRFAAEVKGFDGVGRFGSREARKMDRFVQFAVAAAEEATAQARLQVSQANRDRVGIIVGTGIGGIGTLISNYAVLVERGPDRVSPFLVPMMITDSAAAQVAFSHAVDKEPLASVIAAPTVTIREKIDLIARTLRQLRRASFRGLLGDKATRLEVVVTFLALLELIKRYRVSVEQDALFSDIQIDRLEEWGDDEELELEFE